MPARVLDEHCYYCFDVLLAHLENEDNGTNKKLKLRPSFANDSFPLFVTWSRDDGTGELDLRGCIGNFSAMPLHSGLQEYALTSALRDSRFNPISLKEVQDLSCSVSLLIEFEKGANYLDWTIGVHGIWIEFEDHAGRKRTATYLPEIAKEQKWTKEKTIDSLLRKGGYRGPVSQDYLRTIVLTRYQSQKKQVSFSEYQQQQKQQQQDLDQNSSKSTVKVTKELPHHHHHHQQQQEQEE